MKGKRKDFSQFLHSQVLADVVVDVRAHAYAPVSALTEDRGVQDRERFLAHRVILARNSTFFRAHFLVDGTEDGEATRDDTPNPQAQPKTLNLMKEITKFDRAEIDSAAGGADLLLLPMFPQVLQYLYAGTTDVHEGNVLGLLHCAIRLQIQSLQGLCVTFLKEQTNEHNLFALAATAAELQLANAEGAYVFLTFAFSFSLPSIFFSFFASPAVPPGGLFFSLRHSAPT